MKKNTILAACLVFGMMATVPSGYASHASGLVKACQADLKKSGCKAKTDAEAHECLEKSEVHGAKDDGFSHACYEAHEAYEKKAGKKEEKDEKSEAEHKE